MRRAEPARGGASTPSDMYAIPNRRMATHVVGLPLVWETPLRTGNLRDPNGPQVTFASESFIDELAAAAKADPVEFRLKLLTAEHRRRQRLQARALDRRASRRRPRSTAGTRGRRRSAIGSGDILTGRGIAYAYRSQTVVAQIAEVEVNRRTGHVWVKRLVCAHDCGLVINPEALRRTLEGGMLHSLSRALHEEVRVRHREGDERRLGVASDADARRHAGAIDVVLVNGDPEPEPARTCRTTAPARRSASRRSRRWPTRSTTRPACACAACRSGTRACSRH